MYYEETVKMNSLLLKWNQKWFFLDQPCPMSTRRHVENWINMKKMSTETAGYKFWSKIELVQNSNNIYVIS